METVLGASMNGATLSIMELQAPIKLNNSGGYV